VTELAPRTVTEIGEAGLPAGRQPGSDGSGDRGGALTGGDTIDRGRWLEGEGSRTGPEASRSLEAFRESAAYVLLGAPGAGKTTAFKTEAELAGGHYVTARDFLTLGARSEWRKTDATLFIDGLDEKRAGSRDGRTPLDDIRAGIDAIGRPRFRLSCREADWFGANDREHLDQVAKDGKVKVLRLEPLSDRDIRKLLARHPGMEDADKFLEEARQRGIGYLLTNPQTLKMLADTVSGETWPESRTQTFELACEKLVQESNREHRLANRDAPAAASLLAAGGRLCAVLLLTGRAGYAADHGTGDSEDLDLVSIPDDERTILRLALNTRLFESPEEGRRVPTHRQIAEFLAARYLAKRIDDGLPVQRVLALMTGEDGGIVSELRGLAAWLAAHCLEARGALIERDPEGVAAYGDAGAFTQDEKEHLLKCLSPPDPSLRASLFTSLVTADMVPVTRSILNDRSGDCEHRKLGLFLLCVLANAPPLPDLADSLLGLTMNEDHPPNSRQWAAICLANGALEEPDRFGSLVRRLLSGLREGRLRDEGKNLLGSLLRVLYPKFIGPDEIFDYLDEDHERNRHIRDPLGPYDIFWRHELATEARPEDEVIILDKLEAVFDRSEEWRQTGTPPATPLVRAAHLLVRKALDRTVEHEPRRTLRWLKLAGVDDWGSSSDLDKIRDWLEARPELYKDLLRETVAQCLRQENIQTAKQRVERLLHGAGTPSDYGRWCLEEIEHVEDNDDLVKFWFEEAWNALLRGEGASGVTLEHLEAIATRNASLVQVFDRLRTVDLDGPSARRERKDRQRTLVRRRNKEQVSADWQRFFGQHEEALRENRCPVGPLNTIAEAYLGSYLDIEGKDGRERLRNLLGGGTLVESAMDGLRGAARREDLPTPQDVLALWADNQRHLLAFPVVAGLDLLPEASISALDDSLARVAVALLVASRLPSPGPGWVRPLFESRPDVAAEEIVRFATAALRRGGRQVPLPFVPEILDHEWLSEVARIACPRLLRAFPVRAPRRQFNVLKRLLWWGADHLEASAMAPIIVAKLAARSMTSGQRAYWLAANLAVSGEPDPAPVEDLAERHESAMAGFFAFYERSFRQKRLLERLASPLVGRLARLLGVDRRPLSDGLPRLSEIRKSDLVRTLIEALGTRTDDEAVSALSEIARDPAMAAWHAMVQRVQHNQRAIRRDARYCHPNEEEVRRTLERIQPANVADLAALAFEHISTIAKNIRDGSTNDWRQYWERGSEPWRPAYENDCRDALLSDLKARLHPLGVEAVPEGRYADERRSDIRVSFGGFNVPVEIKKSSSRNLWRGIRDQLITKYARDPGSSGYGIYLVFWFGNHPDPCRMPESGTRPKNAADLEERLRGALSREEARLISIRVIDVAKP